MEDRYLFKGKRLDNGEWIFGFLSIHKTGKCFIKPINVDALSSEEIDKNTICSCTGLKDKNGKLIWENDIAKYHAKYRFGNAYAQIRYGAYQSCFDSQETEHIGFYVDWSENRNYRKDLGYWINTVNAEVVGNIFDNQELLESEGIKMSDLIDTLIKMLKDSNAGYVKTKVGEYTIFVTDDDDGAKVLDEAWENYVEESEE